MFESPLFMRVESVLVHIRVSRKNGYLSAKLLSDVFLT